MASLAWLTFAQWAIAAAMLGLAGFAAFAGGATRLHRAFLALFALKAAGLALFAWDTRLTSLAFRLLIYVDIALPFAAIWFAVQLAQRYGDGDPMSSTRRWLVVALLAGTCLGLELAYAADHSLAIGPRPAFTEGPLLVCLSAARLGFATAALVAARAASRSAEGPRRRALATCSLAFAIEPAFAVTSLLLSLDLGATGWIEWANNLVIPAVTAALLAGCLALFAAQARQERSPAARRRLRGHIFTYSVAVGGAVALNAAKAWSGPAVTRTLVPGVVLLDGFWFLAMTALAAYVVLLCELFHAEMHAKRLLRASVTSGTLAAVFFVVAQSIQESVGGTGFLARAAAAGAVALLLLPVNRAAARLVHRWMPAVAATDDYMRQRRATIYAQAVRAAWRDGRRDARESRALEALAHNLGLARAEAVAIERPLRQTA